MFLRFLMTLALCSTGLLAACSEPDPTWRPADCSVQLCPRARPVSHIVPMMRPMPRPAFTAAQIQTYINTHPRS